MTQLGPYLLGPNEENQGIYVGDALEVGPALLDSCLDLIIEDLPYYKVKNEWWDRQWDSVDGYLEWLDRLCQQWYRLLKPNGSLYVFASSQMAARVEVKVSEWFNMLNRIIWRKGEFDTKAEMFPKDTLRSFFPVYEVIFLCEHYGADNAAKGESGYGTKCDELRGFVFEPLRAYLDGERRRAKVDFEQVRQMVGCADGSGLPSHWFTKSQWMLPTAENFAKLQCGFNQQGRRPAPPYEDYHDAPRSRYERNHSELEYLRADYEDLRADYEDLRADYEDLRADYEDLRRPFEVTPQDQYTDVWDFPTVQAYWDKHPCEKPLEMFLHMIKVSSRPGAVVADFFCGSGVTAEAAMRLGRRYLCCDIMSKWVKSSQRRVEVARLQMSQLEMDFSAMVQVT